MNSVPHCKILTQGFDLENWMEKRWKIGGQVDSWCWEVLQLPSALTTSLAIKTGTTSRSLVCTCSKSLRKLIESKYKQYCPSFPNRHLCRCFKQSYPKHRKVSSYGKHWQFLHGRAEVDWMGDSWVERHPPWSFTSTIKVRFWLSLHKHTWKPMYPGVSGSYLYLAKAYLQWRQGIPHILQVWRALRLQHRFVSNWRRWWKAAVLHWPQSPAWDIPAQKPTTMLWSSTLINHHNHKDVIYAYIPYWNVP